MRLGIDLGGTKIEVIALDEQGQAQLRHRVPTPKGDYAATVEAIVSLIELAVAQVGEVVSIGIGIPGAVSKLTGRIKNANSTWLIGQDLAGDLKQALTGLYNGEIKLANDANCFALSEATDGAGAGASNVFGVIIGTGCGGGWVINGQIVEGVNSIAGEWGHNPLSWQTEADEMLPCYCGQTGCHETFLSGSGFEQHFRLATGMSFSAKEIVDISRQQGHPMQVATLAALDKYYIWLAKGLASVINVMDPEVIVLGGGMGNIKAIYHRVPELWGQWVFSDRVETRLVPPKYGDSSGVRGAAWL